MAGILEKLNKIKAKSELLYRNGVIKKVTRDFFLRLYNDLVDELENYRRNPDIANRENIVKLASEVDELYNILESIKKGLYERQNKAFFEELLDKYVDHEEIDLWILIQPCRFPSCRFFGDDDGREFFYLLQIPSDVNYLSKDLIGILAHEIAHLNPMVNRFVNSIDEQERKVGESIADVLAYSTVEYLFSYSCVYFVRNIITTNRANISRPSHPSWVARLSILNFYTDRIWDADIIIQRNTDILWPIIQQLPPLSASGTIIYNTVARLWKTLQRELIRYKIDEGLLVSLEELSEEEIIQMGEIPKRIWELVMDVHT